MTRHNLCPNPAAKNNATGYGGSAASARVTDIPTPASPRGTGIRTSGSGYLQTPTAACAPGDVFTVSLYGHNGGGFTEGNKTVYVAYTRSAGGDTFPETFSFALGAPNNVVRASFTAAAAPALATGIYLIWDGLGSGLAMTALLFEKVGALDTYADGDTSGWVWDGANGNSTSSETGTTSVSSSLSTPWTVRGSVIQSLSTPWALRSTVSRSLDVPWTQRALVAGSLAAPWAVRGVASGALDVRWALRSQISALLGTPWIVRKRVTSSLQILWVVEGDSQAKISNVQANLTDRVTANMGPDHVQAYLDTWP